MLIKIYHSSRKFFLDLLFPRYCLGCRAEGSWICKNCLKTIDIIKQPYCPECRRPTLLGEFCEKCKKDFYLDGIFVCANFGEGALKEAIHQFKYNFVFDIGEILGKVLISKLVSSKLKDKCNITPDFDLIMPVPLHKKRKVWRGFNQAEILGRELSRIKTNYHELGKMEFINKILVRKRYTTPQMELDREQRLKNLKDVFQIEERSSGSSLQEKNILLVDDITTTGATLEECAKVLKNTGAKSVWAIVLAKGK